MKRSNYLSFTFLAIAISVSIAPNVFATETPEAAAAYANAKAAATTAENANFDSTAISGTASFTIGGNTKPSKAIKTTKTTLAYRISLASSLATTARYSASDSLTNFKNQKLASTDSSAAAASYLTLSGFICGQVQPALQRHKQHLSPRRKYLPHLLLRPLP